MDAEPSPTRESRPSVTTLTVTTEREPSGVTVLRVAGDVDLVSGGEVRERAHRAVAEGCRSVVVDLSAVRFCDSSGVGVLIGLRRLLRSCAGELRLVLPDAQRAGGGCAEVHRVFNALGIRRLFAIHPDLPSAVAEAAAARALSAAQ
jgi:anti-sigma B factor antagonist